MAKPTIPKLTDFPEYAEAQNNLAALGQREADLERRRAAVSAAPVRNDRDVAAAALVKGMPGHEWERISADALDRTRDIVRQGAGTFEVDRNQYSQLTHDLSVTRKAIELQKEVITKLTATLSTRICKDQLRAYREAVRSIAEALAILEVAAKSERDIRLGILEAGFNFTSPLVTCDVPLAFVGEKCSMHARFLEYARQNGLL